MLERIRNIIYPPTEKILPQGNCRPLVSGVADFAGVMIILAVEICIALFLIFTATHYLFKFIVWFSNELKLGEIFRSSLFTPEYFALATGWLKKILLLILLVYVLYKIIIGLGRQLFLSSDELILIKKFPFALTVSRVPLKNINLISFKQYFGERLTNTGTLIVAWNTGEEISIPLIHNIENKYRLIADQMKRA